MESKLSNTKKQATRARRFIRAWLILIGVIALLGLAYTWIIKTLPLIAIKEISRLTNTHITVQAYTLRFDGTVDIAHLSVSPKKQTTYDGTILKARAVHARFNKASLFYLRPKLREIIVQDFVLDAKFDMETEAWNVAGMSINIPKGQGRAEEMPFIKLESGTLRYSKINEGQEEAAAVIPINALLELNRLTEKGYPFELKTAAIYKGLGQSKLTGHWKPGEITLTGGISSKDNPHLERVWSINAMAAQLTYEKAGPFTLQVRIKKLWTSQTLQSDTLDLIPPVFYGAHDPITRLQRFLDRYHPTGTADIVLDVVGHLSNFGESKISGHVTCTDISVQDYKFPYRIDHLAGRIDFTNTSYETTPHLTGKHNDTPLQVQFSKKGAGANRIYDLRLFSESMPLDQDLYDALSENNRRWWSRVDPNGFVGIDYHYLSTVDNKTKNLTVTLKDTHATYQGFAYPLRKLSGTITFDDEKTVFSQVRTHDPDRSISINGNITRRPASSPQYNLTIEATDIPVDAPLKHALSTKQRAVLDDLKFLGKLDARIRVTTGPTPETPIAYATQIHFKGASLILPYNQLPVCHLQGGPVTLASDTLHLEHVTGSYHGHPVSASGTVYLANDSELNGYDLTVHSPNISVAAAREALTPQARTAIDWFSPQGHVNVTASLKKAPQQGSGGYMATIGFMDTHIQPKLLPYPFERMTGSLVVDSNQVLLQDVALRPTSDTAQADPSSSLVINGRIALAKGRMQSARLQLAASLWPFDEQLGRALPPGFSDAYQQLLPTGTLSLEPTNIQLNRAVNGALHVTYFTNARLKNVTFRLLGGPAQFNGGLQITGQYATDTGTQQGIIALSADTLTIRNKTAQDLHALIHFDPGTRQWTSQDVMATFYGGHILGQLDLITQVGHTAEVQLQLGLVNADLSQFAADTQRDKGDSTTKTYSQGTINGNFSLIANLGPQPGRTGRCLFTVTDMRVGRVSLFSQLFSVLQLTEPRDFIYDKMLMDSYIKGDELLIEKFDMSGESLAFQGEGRLNLLDEEVDLTLIARGRRLATADPSILQSLTEGLFGAVARLKITGTINTPKIVPQALPMLEDSLKILGSPEK